MLAVARSSALRKVWAKKMIELGPPSGIFAKPTKSLLVVKPEFVGQAKELFADLKIPVVSSGKYIRVAVLGTKTRCLIL